MKMSYFEENIANNKQVDEATKRYSLSRQSSELGRKIKEAKTYAECFVLSRKIKDLSSKMTVKGMYMDISNVLKGIQKDINVNVDINVTYPLQDSYGNISEDIVIKATFNNETIKKINFDNFDYNNIPSIADEWWNHQALNY